MKKQILGLLLAGSLLMTIEIGAQTPTKDGNGGITLVDTKSVSGDVGNYAKPAKAWKTVPWSTVEANNWMAAVPDSTKISALSIPGTHDSGARFENWPGSARCQSMTIEDQLYSGVRYLDIRLRPIDDKLLVVHHGPVYQNMNFGDVLGQVIGFLKANPSETVLMCVKPEHDAENCKDPFAKIFHRYISNNKNASGDYYRNNFWNVKIGDTILMQRGTNIPSLGEGIRGKIVLIRRFSEDPNDPVGGIDATDWPDDKHGCVQAGPHVFTQDEYSMDFFNGRPKKLEGIKNTMDTAYHYRSSGDLYLNYSSGKDDSMYASGVGIPFVAAYMNPALDGKDGLLNTKAAPYGVIAMDFVNKSLANYAWKSNARVETPAK
jgi:1-phosphatidylinositol phosphodiesterase